MNEEDFEGSSVLEKLAEIGAREAFFDAVDSDDFTEAAALMKRAGLDDQTIRFVLQKMKASDGTH
jgi:hypothetical protein